MPRAFLKDQKKASPNWRRVAHAWDSRGKPTPLCLRSALAVRNQQSRRHALLQEEALFSEGGGDGEGFGSHGHPKVHSKHLSKIEAKVSADREANASF